MSDPEVGCGTCAICLNTISPADEAFLDVCFHQFCYKCIKEWTFQQRRHPPAQGPFLTCPLCKQGYYSIIYDCHDSAFRREQVAAPPRGSRPPAPAATFANLSSMHRRRRSVYYSPPNLDGRAALAAGTLGHRLASRPDVQRWVQRELQALMWEDDVALVAQHVLGTLRTALAQAGGASTTAAGAQQHSRSAKAPDVAAPAALRGANGGTMVLKRKALLLTGGGSSGGDSAPVGLASTVAVAGAIATAAAPYVFEHAERFGWELVRYVASGQTLAAYDREHKAQPAGPGATAGAGSEGAREDSVGTEAAAGRRGSASGGPGSEPSSSGRDEDESSSRGRESSLDGSPHRSDSEGYLELLLTQGRPRQRGAGTAAGGIGSEVAVDAGDTGGDAASGAFAGANGVGAGRPGGEGAEELEGYRSRALEALQQYRSGGSGGNTKSG